MNKNERHQRKEDYIKPIVCVLKYTKQLTKSLNNVYENTKKKEQALTCEVIES